MSNEIESSILGDRVNSFTKDSKSLLINDLKGNDFYTRSCSCTTGNGISALVNPTKPSRTIPLRASMSQRRPLLGTDLYFLNYASYFSEGEAREQYRRQEVIDKWCRPKLGDYKFCQTRLIKKHRVPGTSDGVTSCKFSLDGQYLALGLGNGMIQICSLNYDTSNTLVTEGVQKKITAIRFLGDNSPSFLASSLNGCTFILQLSPSGAWKASTFFNEKNNEINAMDISADRATLATAGKDAVIRHYDAKTAKLTGVVKNISNGMHSKRICALKYDSNNTSVFISGGWDNIVKVWDVRSPDCPVLNIQGPQVTGDSLDILGNSILSGQWTCKKSLQLWDIRTGKLITDISPHNRVTLYSGEFINSLKFIRNNKSSLVDTSMTEGDLIIAAGSGTKALEVISIKENLVLHTERDRNSVIAVDNFGSFISYGGRNEVNGILEFLPQPDENIFHNSVRYKPITIKCIERKKSFKAKNVDMEWLKSFEDFKRRKRSSRKNIPFPSEKEQLIGILTQEVKDQESGVGPQSLLGEKLGRYLSRNNQCPELRRLNK